MISAGRSLLVDVRVTIRPAASEIKKAGTCDTRPSPIVERGINFGRAAQVHAVLEHADAQSRQNVDDRDHDAGDGVAADELAGTVHGPVEVGLFGDLFAAAAGLFLVISPAFRSASIAICLPGMPSKANRAATSLMRRGTLGDDQKLNRDQDREDRKADEELPAGDELAERLNHVAGGGRAVLGPAREDQPRRRDVQHQPRQRRSEQNRRKHAEVERPG